MQTATGRRKEEIRSHVMQTRHKSSVSGRKVFAARRKTNRSLRQTARCFVVVFFCLFLFLCLSPRQLSKESFEYKDVKVKKARGASPQITTERPVFRLCRSPNVEACFRTFYDILQE